jgi:AraC-like DNA-binding protein
MKLFVKYDINKACRMLLQEQLDKLGVAHTITAFGEVEIAEALGGEKMKTIAAALGHYGIEIVESQKNIIIQKIKDAIIEMVFNEDALPSSKISYYLSEKLGYSYGYISNLFSDATFSSIENFIILQKIERAKQLIITNEYTFTEIAWKLNYSSVAHFSTQFKNATGLTPSAFQRIINKRREAAAK